MLLCPHTAETNVNDLTKNILVFVVIIVVLLSVVQGLSGVSGGQPQSKDYSDFLTQVRSGQVALVEIEGRDRFASEIANHFRITRLARRQTTTH